MSTSFVHFHGLLTVLFNSAGFLRACPEGLTEISDILLLSSIIPLVLVIIEAEKVFIGLGLLAIFVFSIYRETRSKPSQLKEVSKTTSENKNEKKSISRLKTLLRSGSAQLSLQYRPDLLFHPVLISPPCLVFLQ